ncbi:hypothetical protein ACK3TF_000009 [Chlorella vulgaris]
MSSAEQPQAAGEEACVSAAQGPPDPPSTQEPLDGASQSAVNAYDRMLHDKERSILENIARKRTKIHAVERQLAELQLALHVNVEPRRQALEHLRGLIEQQSHKVDTARTNYKRAKQEMEHWQQQMEEADQRKQQLAVELNTLVQQSAGAQLKKLEELSSELERLTEGPQHVAAANGADTAAEPLTTPRPAAQHQPVAGSAGQGQQAQHATAAASAVGEGQATRDEAEQQRQRQLQQQRQAASAARGRHVQLLPGRKPGSADGGRGGARGIPLAPATGGAFQGFE